MPILRINATSRGLALHDKAGDATRPLEIMQETHGPVVIMLHGYKYAPNQLSHSPHEKIFGSGETGWPAQLGFRDHGPDAGLAIAFGWYARGPLHSVYKRATKLGETLSVLIAMLKAQAPHRPVHIIAHSLGCQSALSALQHLPAGAVDRLVLLTGASFQSYARAMLETPAGQQSEVFNITSRENDVFDMAFERLVAPHRKGDRAIGEGIDMANVRTLQIDCDRTLAAFANQGFPVEGPRRRVCHWSAYTRPGLMKLYAGLLCKPEELPLSVFDTNLPATQTPRWSRIGCTAASLSGLPLRGLPLVLRAGKRMMGKAPMQGKSHEHAY